MNLSSLLQNKNLDDKKILQIVLRYLIDCDIISLEDNNINYDLVINLIKKDMSCIAYDYLLENKNLIKPCFEWLEIEEILKFKDDKNKEIIIGLYGD